MTGKTYKPTPCPTCGAMLRVEPRGETAWIARCPAGQNNPRCTDHIFGCHAEFGTTPEEAVARVIEAAL